MKEVKDSLAYRKNILKNLIDKPPFRYEKMSSDSGSIDINESENVVNISFSTNRQDSASFTPQFSNERCHTTINLFINDPHLARRNFDDLPQNGNMEKNKIYMGKNIPNHNVMEKLLSDIDVKKYSSAPNVRPAPKRKSVVFSKSIPTGIPPETITRAGNIEAQNKEMSFLYVNDKRCSGDFNRKHFGKEALLEKDEGKRILEDKIKDTLTHRNDQHVMRVLNDQEIMENRYHPASFQRKPIHAPTYAENSSILYRDSTEAQLAEVRGPGQPRRTVPSFRVRTQMVRDVLNANPEYINTYYSKLFNNQKKMFETLRQIDFQEHVQEINQKIVSNEITNRLQKDTIKRDQDEDSISDEISVELFPMRQRGKIDEVDKTVSSHILNGNNSRTVCSIKSHGAYDDYKKNLVKRPDGSLCCKNTNYTDDDVWSRAETRNIITTEFIKDKVRRFERFTRKAFGNQENHQNDWSMANRMTGEMYGAMNIYGESSNLPEIHQQESHPMNISNENLESVSFPKETKNAMRLLADNLRNSSKFNRLKSQSRKWNNQLENRINAGHVTKSRSELVKAQEKNSRFWPGMAERVRARPEENIP